MSMENADQFSASRPAGKNVADPCSLHGGMTCKDCVDFLLDYVDGVLPAERVSTFHAHLAVCPDCTVYLENYRKAALLTSGLSRQERHEAAVGQTAPVALVDAILKARKTGAGRVIP